MPKKVLEINPFHGGMNDNTDPRDLQHDELVSAKDVMVDNIGRIRTGPSLTAHASNSPSITIDDIADRGGTSLFAFSHDHKYAGNSGNIIQYGSSGMNTGSVWGGWSASSANWVASSAYFTYAGATAGSTKITQTAANRLQVGVGGANYKLTYTISNYTLTYGTPTLSILGGSGEFAASAVSLATPADGTFVKTFTSHASAKTAVFSIEASDIQMTFRLDNIKLELIKAPSTGGNYLALYMNTSSKYRFGIYDYGEDTWNYNDEDIRFNSVSTAAEPVYTFADGALRIVDRLNGEQAGKIHYSYIDRIRFGTNTVYCKKWLNASSMLTKPTDSDIVFSAAASTYSPDEGKLEIGSQTLSRQVTNTGTWNPNGAYNGTATAGSGANKLVSSGTTFTSDMVGMRVRRTNNTEAAAIITKFEDANTIYCSKTITSHVGGDTAKGSILTWSSSGTADTFDIFDYYDIGFTWVYDGNQESLIHNRTFLAETVYNNVSFYLQDIAAGHDWDTESTGRKTGANVYYRKESDDSKTWYHLFEVDLNKGFRLSNQDDFTITWTQITALTEYHLQEIEIQDPLTFETYETRNGFKSDDNNLLDLTDPEGEGMGYSASIIANRVHYIANITYQNKEGVIKNYGDLMLKSVVNKFDTFPLDRKIEVSVQDGDEITALAAYADRILQFKKTKMHLINVSQEIEFLEDTFKFKGVFSQAAVCETDFGIAWVNTFGCYLYDGQKVSNLLEQKGVRKIASSSWVYDENFRPMVAYLPKERQLFVAKDHAGGDGAAGAQEAWIYDMVTQSWVLQSGSFLAGDAEKYTNLVTDHKGDIIYVKGTGTINTLSTSSAAKSGVSIVTADMNFGDSAVRKKVYRVRVSYKGDASALLVRYTVNGDTDTLYNFQGTSSGAPTGSADTSPLEDKSGDITVWHHAELKPATASQATNIYSFQVHITGTAGATFELNDLSVIFRIKNIK